MKTTLFISSFLIASLLHAQVEVTSVQNGNFSNPTTWNCNCIPSSIDYVFIYHDVIMDIDWTITDNYIEVDSMHSLIQSGSRSIFVTGNSSEFINYGTAEIDNLLLTNGGWGLNSGNFTLNKILSVSSTSLFSTNKIFSGADTIYNAGQFYGNGSITCGNFLSNGTTQLQSTFISDSIANSGTIYIYNGDINSSAFATSGTVNLNSGAIRVSGNFYNSSSFNVEQNSLLEVMGKFTNNDIDSVGSGFLNDGNIAVFQDFYNSQTIYGSGNICVNGYSENSANLNGSLDFCDASGTDFDLNTGIIGSSVTFCQSGCIAQIEEETSSVSVFPNPTSNRLFILGPNQFETAIIYDLTGKLIEEKKVIEQYISVENLNSGIYFVIFNGSVKTLLTRIVVD